MKRYIEIILFVTLLLSVQKVAAQNYADQQSKQIDSINLIINNQKNNDTTIVNGYLQLVEIFGYSNLDTILPITSAAKNVVDIALQKKLSKSQKLALKSQLANIYYYYGYYYQYKGEVNLALDNLFLCLNIQVELDEKEAQASTYNILAYIYEDLGDIKKALNYYEKSIEISEETNRLETAVATLNNLGMLYNDQNEISKAIEYTQKSLDMAHKINDTYSVGVSLNNFGTIHSNFKNYEKSIKFYKESVEIRKKINDSRGLSYSISGLAHSLNKLSKIEKEKGNYLLADSLLKTSFEYYNESLNIRISIGDKRGEVESLNYIGKYYFEVGNVEKAYNYLTNSLTKAEELGYPKLIERNATLLFKLERDRGNYKEALKMRDLEILMKDSLENESNLRATLKQQSKYEYEKQKAIDDKENEKKVALEKQKQKDQFIVLIIVVIAAALVLILLLIIYRRLQLTRKQKLIIEEQKEEVESQRDQIEEQRDDIVASINYAKRIQEAILPSLTQIKEVLPQSFVLYKPKDVVAGDFYWQETYKGKVYVAAADCTGHGVPGAMLSVVCSNALTKAVLEDGITDVAKILDRTREIVISKLAKSSDVKDGMDISLACFDFDNMKLEWAGANNPLYILRHSAPDVESQIEITKGDREAIGYTDNPTPFTKHTFDLQKGDTIYLFTDGYADQFGGENGRKLGYKNFREKLIELSNLEMDKQNFEFESYFEEWKGSEEQVDDVCVIGIKI